MRQPSRLADAQSRPDLGPLANRVLAGRDVEDPLRIADFIHESPDITSSFLVCTPDGDVIINTGATGNGAKHKARYAKVSHAPVEYILLTQSHIDHVSGVEALREPGTKIVAQERFQEIAASRRQLAPFWQRRKDRLLKSTLGDNYSNEFIEPVVPDITFERHHEFTLGGRDFELFHVPGGETLDSMMVWLPRERILFTGNMFGPIIGDLPNLYTIRGERIRSATQFVRCVDLALSLEPQLVVDGHANGTPLRAAEFSSKAMRVRDAVQWLHDATIAGMNEGQDVWTLMGNLRLPEELDVAQTHGKVAWCVRAIWEEYVGWFHFDSTTSLYDVRPAAVHPDLVELAGGLEPIVARARAKLGEGAPLEAIYLAEIALTVDLEHTGALEVSRRAHEKILDGTGRQNFFETFWLKSCIDEIVARST